MNMRRAAFLLSWLGILSLAACAADPGARTVPASDAAPAFPAKGAVPVFSATGPDAAAYGQAQGYPVELPMKRQQNMVGNYSNVDRLFHTRVVAAAAQASPLGRAAQELAVTYTFRGRQYTLQDYLARNPATGLLIARDDTILFEHYQYGRTDHNRFNSQSMAKTVTSMLVGIAISEGAIHSVDDMAQAYVPELAGTQWGQTSIRALLHMASGIAFTQGHYDGTDDDQQFSNDLFSRKGPGAIGAIARFDERIAPPETLWNYANINPEVLALVLTRATHMTMSAYLQSRIWQPMGAESAAKWQLDGSSQEPGFCCFNATLRDYARLALVLAHDGAWNGRQIIPRQWLLDATEPVTEGSYLAIEKGPHPWGYGYQLWLMPGPQRSFVLEGIEGQRIFVDPQSHTVLVHTAVRLKATHDPGEFELIALWRAVRAQGRAAGN
jgi:CubicO group peptidase (beta-lactamase class C family)